MYCMLIVEIFTLYCEGEVSDNSAADDVEGNAAVRSRVSQDQVTQGHN